MTDEMFNRMILGPEDYLIWPRLVHVMRYQGKNDEGHKWWRIACGTKLKPETWDNVSPAPPLEEISKHNIGYCKKCWKTKK